MERELADLVGLVKLPSRIRRSYRPREADSVENSCSVMEAFLGCYDITWYPCIRIGTGYVFDGSNVLRLGSVWLLLGYGMVEAYKEAGQPVESEDPKK